MNPVLDLVQQNRRGAAVGLYSVCSANPWVLEAAMRQALADDSLLLVESTSNQVNQFGGYTGQTPRVFAELVRAMAGRVGLDWERVVLGGDHLGPYPWRDQPAATALENAAALVRECVRAGYRKIHLDASMRCAGDPKGPPAGEVVAERSAMLCRVAEEAGAPVYVVGTEVPVPGGETAEGEAPVVTSPEDAARTLELTRAAFSRAGLAAAWERVVGLVVQPGVEFSNDRVFDYDRSKAARLSASLPAHPELVYEAHSTDYQPARALREMVEDHFAILKVGPWLTFAFREAVFALSAIEREWIGGRSRVRETLEAAMLANPVHWKPYYRGERPDLFSYSDRCRYYWPEPAVQAELERLLANLTAAPPPLALLSQYLPAQYEAVRAGAIQPFPAELILDRIRNVLRLYAAACKKGSA